MLEHQHDQIARLDPGIFERAGIARGLFEEGARTDRVLIVRCDQRDCGTIRRVFDQMRCAVDQGVGQIAKTYRNLCECRRR